MKSLNKLFLMVSLVCLGFISGCASVDIPNYIQDDNPYKKTFSMSYDEVLNATKQAMKSAGWTVSQEANPAVYEQSRIAEAGVKQTLLFTETRQLGLVVGTRYARLNVYVYSANNISTEVEIRYITANSVGFKTFYNYQHDKSVANLFRSIEGNLIKTEQ